MNRIELALDWALACASLAVLITLGTAFTDAVARADTTTLTGGSQHILAFALTAFLFVALTARALARTTERRTPPTPGTARVPAAPTTP